MHIYSFLGLFFSSEETHFNYSYRQSRIRKYYPKEKVCESKTEFLHISERLCKKTKEGDSRVVSKKYIRTERLDPEPQIPLKKKLI